MKKRTVKIIALMLSVVFTVTLFASCGKKEEVTSSEIISETASETSSDIISSLISSIMESSKPASSKKPSVSSRVTSSAKRSGYIPPSEAAPGWKHSGVSHNGNVDMDDNIFMDALGYTGYNLAQHRADGMMWKYVLAENKRKTTWLSGIGFGGGSTGLETKNGLPDIAAFRRGGLVCASFASYVYFNYLPNVAGVDTSFLTRPQKTYLAPSFYAACKDWVKKGYSRNIAFTASGSIKTFLKMEEKEEIPIGSIICFHDAEKPNSTECSHVCIYAGYRNGYHWVYQTGNKNGPEFCAVERFLFGPDPQMLLAIFTCPLSESVVNKTAIKNAAKEAKANENAQTEGELID